VLDYNESSHCSETASIVRVDGNRRVAVTYNTIQLASERLRRSFNETSIVNGADSIISPSSRPVTDSVAGRWTLDCIAPHSNMMNTVKRLILGCIHNTAFDRSLARNPYNVFQNYDLRECSACFFSTVRIRIKPLTVYFETGQYILAPRIAE